MGCSRGAKNAFGLAFRGLTTSSIVIALAISIDALGASAASAAAPPNDTCIGADIISTTMPALGSAVDITDATTAGDPTPIPGTPCTVASTLSRSVWYRFTPSETAVYSIENCADAPCGSTVDDLVMAIYTSPSGACGGPYTQIACDDDSCAQETFQASIITQLNAGITYHIVLWKFDSTAPTAGNSTAQLRITRTSPTANDSCAAPVPLQLNRTTATTAVAARNDYELAAGSSCFTGPAQFAVTAAGADTVYSFTAPTAAHYSFKAWNTSGQHYVSDPFLYMAASCPAATKGTPVMVACTVASNRGFRSEEIVCQPLAAGQQVFLFFDHQWDDPDFYGPFLIQAETCTAQESEGNDTPASADLAACTLEGSISPGGDVDFFAIGAPPAGWRIFAMVEAAGSLDGHTVLRITTATDTLEYDAVDSVGAFMGANVAGTPASGGQIFARVSGYNGTTVHFPYRLYTTVQQPSGSATAESEPNGATATADAAASNYFAGTLAGPAPSTDQDHYSFHASAGDLIFLSLDGDPSRDATPIDAELSLLDATGGILITAVGLGSTSDTTFGGGSVTATHPYSPADGLVFRAPATGTFYARVAIQTASTTEIGAGDYLLSISKNCGGSRLKTITPCRAVDTRNPPGPLGGPSLDGGVPRIFPLVGTCGIPPSAKALALNVTAIDANSSGYLTVYPADIPNPNTRVVSYNAGATRASIAVIGLAADGTLAVFPATEFGSDVQVVIDVTGYFE